MRDIDISTFQQKFSKVLREAMLDAAEPLVQECLVKIDRRLAEVLAEKCVGLIEHSYSLERNGNILRIEVNLGVKKDG